MTEALDNLSRRQRALLDRWLPGASVERDHGWGVVETWRKENGLPTLKEASREPSYIRIAGELGLGVFDKNKIAMREVRL